MKPFTRFTLLCLSAFLTSSCSTPAPAPPPAPQFWGGEMKAVVSVKELMRDVLDPLSDHIFLAVGTEITAKGTVERVPKTDEDWARVRTGAVGLAEASYLLKVPRPFAPPGDENNSTGPDAPELSPAQIKAKLEKDPVLWQAKIEALRNVSLAVMEIVKKKDVKALFDVGEDLDAACENCHLEFWYPGQKNSMPKLDKMLREMSDKHAAEAVVR